MKLHWGHGIAIFLSLFVLTLIYVLVSSMRIDHHLVADDYYKEDLAYQSQYAKVEKQKASDNLSIDYDAAGGVVSLLFDSGAQSISGKAHFYRPSDANLDFEVTLSDAQKDIDVSKLASGKWLVKVDWVQDQTAYYKEETLFL